MRTSAIIVANLTGWPALQLLIARAVTRMSPQRFASDVRINRVGDWEIQFYRRWLRIRRWKGLLPDGALWVGGSFRKSSLHGRSPEYLREFAVQTRRGEFAHWIMLACAPIFFLWNPLWACIVMVLYAVAANLPCIVTQRYNREIVRRLLLHRDKSA